MCYANYEAEEVKEHKPKVVFVDDENKISRVTNYEKHGLLKIWHNQDCGSSKWVAIRRLCKKRT